MLSFVGRDLFYGSDRLTFGQLELAAGIALIPLLIGLFAVSEVLSHYATKAGERQTFSGVGERLTWPEFRRPAADRPQGLGHRGRHRRGPGHGRGHRLVRLLWRGQTCLQDA